MTPALVIDVEAVVHNIDAVISRVGHTDRWRPHIKTLKQGELIAELMKAGVHRFKCATLDELALVLETGARIDASRVSDALSASVDVVVAYPLAAPAFRELLRLRSAHPKVQVRALANDPEHLRELDAWVQSADLRDGGGTAEGPPLSVFLDVDLGMARTGTSPEAWLEASPFNGPERLSVDGLHGYDGHIGFGEAGAARTAYGRLCDLARAAPQPAALELCTSGSHSYPHALADAELLGGPWRATISPGTVILDDLRSAPAHEDLGLQQAAWVLSRVVRRHEDTLTLDAGSKGITPDAQGPSCAAAGHPELHPLRASEEHLPCRIEGASDLRRGDLVWLIPDHVCTTVNLHRDVLYVRPSRGEIVDGEVDARSRRIRPHRLGLGLACLLALPPSVGCSAENELPLRVILPEDRSGLDDIDNATLVLDPDQELSSYAIDGVDFSLALTLPEGDGPFLATLYLAEGQTLAAWGQSVPFYSTAVSDGSLSLFAGYPGRLSTFPRTVGELDAGVWVAQLRNRGALLVEPDGDTFVFGTYALELGNANDLAAAETSVGGGLWSTLDGGALRLAWEGSPRASYFDPRVADWRELELGDLPSGLAPNAALAVSEDDEKLWILDATGATSVDLDFDPEAETLALVTTRRPLALDRDRAGGTAVWVDDELVVWGGATTGPLAFTERGGASGPEGSWTGASCWREPDVRRVVCGGGLRDGVESSDLVELRADANGDWSVSEFPDALGAPMPSLIWLADDTALYAQGEARLRPLSRDTLSPLAEDLPASRARGGHSIQLPTGATFLVGGTGFDGTPLQRWQVFTPALLP